MKRGKEKTNRKLKLNIFQITIIVIILLWLAIFFYVNVTINAKYKTVAQSDGQVVAARPVIEIANVVSETQTIVNNATTQVITFDIVNFNETKTNEVTLTYDIEITEADGILYTYTIENKNPDGTYSQTTLTNHEIGHTEQITQSYRLTIICENAEYQSDIGNVVIKLVNIEQK